MKLHEIPFVVDYFLDADQEFLKGMGADKNKLPKREKWIGLFEKKFEIPVAKKKFFDLIWLLNDIPVGHSNINNISYGKQATMHLHLWQSKNRKQGLGSAFVKLSIPIYFETFQLDKLICEPYAGNPAPNQVLKKVGFNFIKSYETTPGWINFHQKVCKYEFTKEMLGSL